MKQENYTAILIKATDYRESDKLVRLFTVEGGIISAVMKGVKKPNAKLKFGAQPFAFCEYSIVSNGGYNTVAGCVQIEDLFALTQDADKYIFASVMAEAADRAVGELPDPNVFVMLLKALKATLYGDSAPAAVLVKLLQTLVLRGGYEQKLPQDDNAVGVIAYLTKVQNSRVDELPSPPDEAVLSTAVKRTVKTFEKHFPPALVSAKLL